MSAHQDRDISGVDASVMTSHHIPAHGHNPSLQAGVDPNPDLALHFSHEFQKEHRHHGSTSHPEERGQEILYTRDGPLAENNTTLFTKPVQNYDTHHLRGEGHQDMHDVNLKDMTSDTVESSVDAEKGGVAATKYESTVTSSDDGRKHRIGRFYQKYKLGFHIAFWLFWTGWWIAGLILHRYDLGWLIPFLLYLAITIRLITFWVPISIVTKPMRLIWAQTGTRVHDMIPPKLRLPAAAAVTVATIVVGTFASATSASNTRGYRAISLLGLAIMIAVLAATSRNFKKIRWHTVIGGMLTQFIIALFVLRTKTGYDIFNFISFLARALLGYADEGTTFLTAATVPDLHWFLTGVIPPIIFFVALVQCLYYLGVLQWFIGKFAVFFFWTLRVSGAEAVVAAASPFVGQGESAMLIRPFITHLTMAEIHQVMCSGFATIAGSVLVAYIGLGLNPQALVSSCIMSIPASLAVSKLRYPETEETITSGRVVIPDDDEHKATNLIHAFANGAWMGIKIAGMIVATLLCIIAVIGLINGLLGWWGRYLNITQDGEPYLTLQLILGYICYPVAFLLGVPFKDLQSVGQLIGIKVIANEFVAFYSLTNDAAYANLDPRSRLIATYALCGFGNFGSLGTQIGILTQLAPSRAGDVSKVAMSALFTGVIATLSSASIAGMVIIDQQAYFSPSS